jgi:hypothetical protein
MRGMVSSRFKAATSMIGITADINELNGKMSIRRPDPISEFAASLASQMRFQNHSHFSNEYRNAFGELRFQPKRNL